ncbi:DUF3047 domain-containing protein [Amphritea sp. HPY]|uniref:DUF3047 domain-containing protein n=1 Tax=Amphritea sp. HPY TaxID=3421652 RepID=UPI003D7C9D58
MPSWKSIITSLIIALPSSHAGAMTIPLFDENGIKQWHEKTFSGTTHYQITKDNNQPVLQAVSDDSASGLYYEQQLPISPTTTLEWSWKVANTFPSIDETSKAGDDYPARIYVIVSDGPFFWQTHTLVYVWASSQPTESRWPNAYTSNAVMWAVDSGDKQLNRWISHSRNLQQDLKTAFGKTYQQIEAIAIMSDSDNSKNRSTAWYGNICLK